MTKQDFFKIILPKWPECRVDGKSVTKEQAQEILIRTQGFLFSSNNRPFHQELLKTLGVETKEEYPYHDWDDLSAKAEEYHCLPLSYLSTERICSCYIGGPNGWLDWDGEIYQTGNNIGKWPSVESVYEDWKLIAKTFPYLDLRCQLFSGEGCEKESVPVVEFIVKNGKVRMKIPTKELLPQDQRAKDHLFKIMVKNRFLDVNAEKGISIQGFKEALDQTKKALAQSNS